MWERNIDQLPPIYAPIKDQTHNIGRYSDWESNLQRFGLQHRWQTQACGPNPALHLVLSGPAPCFYPAASPSSLPQVKEQLHLYSPKITFGPFKATARLIWPPMKMNLTPGLQDDAPTNWATLARASRKFSQFCSLGSPKGRHQQIVSGEGKLPGS